MLSRPPISQRFNRGVASIGRKTPSRCRPFNSSANCQQLDAPRPAIAPKVSIDIKAIRQSPDLYAKNCLDRNYKTQSEYPARINSLFEEWQNEQRRGRSLRERSNLLRRQLANPNSIHQDDGNDSSQLRNSSTSAVHEEAKELKSQLTAIESKETELTRDINALAAAIPNLTSDLSPRGDVPAIIDYINTHPETVPSQVSDRVWRSHVHIGSELNLLDFTASATSSGWGWYYLLNEAALLEQALIQYSLSVAMSRAWQIVSPPSIVYNHIASACGFQPRDQNDEQQIYSLTQTASDAAKGKPLLSLAATAEIPLAAMLTNSTIDASDLPLKRIAVSRCYRAEAGARGVDTKGLYRVHEFTKVEMFAWTKPDHDSTIQVFDEMVSIQRQILTALGLHCKILEMPSTDLGASAFRKIDIESFFPSRRERDEGWGEVTSASICTDYQSRRLATRMSGGRSGKLEWPWTCNGTAMAIPRVLAAILENGWDEKSLSVTIPEVLKPWMGGQEKIVMRKWAQTKGPESGRNL